MGQGELSRVSGPLSLPVQATCEFRKYLRYQLTPDASETPVDPRITMLVLGPMYDLKEKKKNCFFFQGSLGTLDHVTTDPIQTALYHVTTTEAKHAAF